MQNRLKNRMKILNKMNTTKLFTIAAMVSQSMIFMTSLIFSPVSLAEAQVAPSTQTAETSSDQAASNKTQIDAETNKKTDAKKTPVLAAPKTTTRNTEDVFRPSEEISEDFAVPFPTDI
jgi:hypothetical protein